MRALLIVAVLLTGCAPRAATVSVMRRLVLVAALFAGCASSVDSSLEFKRQHCMEHGGTWIETATMYRCAMGRQEEARERAERKGGMRTPT